jgi:hypothetical protein
MNTHVNFKLSKILKKSGFDLPCDKMFNSIGDVMPTKLGMYKNPNKYNGYYSAPTIGDVLMWFLKEHKIWIFSDYGKKTSNWYYNIQFLPGGKNNEVIIWKEGFDSPEKAHKKAIEYCLTNLIQK